MNLKEKTIADIIGREGGYCNDPGDSGGETCWGITITEARANGYTGYMRELPRSFAEAIYAKKYWDALRLDEVAALSEPVAAELADTGVNMGIGTAVKFLQRSLNVFTKAGLAVDGGMGPATIEALRSYLAARRHDDGEAVLVRALNGLQAVRYIELAEGRPENRAFVFGWLRSRCS